MADPINDGGPAFPRIRNHVDSFGSLHQESDGMTLRDWFAGQALVGQLSNSEQVHAGVEPTMSILSGDRRESYAAFLAKEAYTIADAMLLASQSATTVPQGGKSYDR